MVACLAQMQTRGLPPAALRLPERQAGGAGVTRQEERRRIAPAPPVQLLGAEPQPRLRDPRSRRERWPGTSRLSRNTCPLSVKPSRSSLARTQMFDRADIHLYSHICRSLFAMSVCRHFLRRAIAATALAICSPAPNHMASLSHMHTWSGTYSRGITTGLRRNAARRALGVDTHITPSRRDEQRQAE